MAMGEAPCMKGGTGESSYANNSIIQRSVIVKVRPILKESLRALIGSSITNSPGQCLTIADLGCSCGPNTLAILESVIDITVSTCKDLGRPTPEFNMLVNDLPENDFNTIFKSLPGFYKMVKEEKGIETGCFVSGTPGSFHGRLFPSNSVHFMHSSTSLHFLSQVPKGKFISASQGISTEVVEAYKEQFGKDFNMFLRSRSKEIVNGGRMLLTIPCTSDGQALPLIKVVGQVLNKLATQGLINKESLDTFDLQVYMPSSEQVKKVIEEEGSFMIDKEFAFTMNFHDAILMSSPSTSSHVDIHHIARVITSTFRAGCENLLAKKFGEEILEPFFSFLQDMSIESLTNGEDFGSLNLVVSLVAK